VEVRRNLGEQLQRMPGRAGSVRLVHI